VFGDIFWAVATAIPQVVTGYLGWHVTVDNIKPERKTLYKTLFVVFSLLGIIVVGVVAHRAPKPLTTEDIVEAVSKAIPSAQGQVNLPSAQTSSKPPTKAEITQIIKSALAAANPGAPMSNASSNTPPLAQKQSPASPSASGVNVYQELQDAMEAVENESNNDWKYSIIDGISVKTRGREGSNDPVLVATLDGRFKEQMIRLHERVINEVWPKLEPRVRQAHADSIQKMTRLTSNEITADNQKFNSLVDAIRQKAFDSSKPDLDRFDPLVSYLKDLLKQLGDYPPNS
jgi:hypothetical protein